MNNVSKSLLNKYLGKTVELFDKNEFLEVELLGQKVGT